MKHYKRCNIGGGLSVIRERCAHTKRGHVERLQIILISNTMYIREGLFAFVFVSAFFYRLSMLLISDKSGSEQDRNVRLLPRSKKVVGSIPGMRPFCVEFLCYPCICEGSPPV